jgi:hypothetical protein
VKPTLAAILEAYEKSALKNKKEISYPLFTLPEKFSIPKMKMAIKIEIIFGDDQSDDTRGL